MNMTTKILIADDHPLFRDALIGILEPVLGNDELVQVENYQLVREQLESRSFKLAFVDLDMPDSNGLTDLALLRKLSPQTPLVVVSAHDSPKIIKTCFDYGVAGYILKSMSSEDIRAAVNIVLDGGIFTPKDINFDSDDKNEKSAAITTLTPSQLKVLMGIGEGKLNKQIAFDLGITEATVKAHITTIFKKLNIYNRTQAVLIAKEHAANLPKID